MHAAFVKAALDSLYFHAKRPDSVVALHSLDGPRERPEWQRVWKPDSIP
jgi:hypothetical protein